MVEDKEEFVKEAIELLDDAEDALLAMESGDNFRESFRRTFRAIHSIKGAASVYNLDYLNKLFDHLERLLEKYRESEQLPDKVSRYILNGFDAARSMVSGGEVEFALIDPLIDQGSKSGREEDDPESQKLRDEFRRQMAVMRQSKGKVNGHIFVIDDEPDILDLVSHHLEEDGYEVETFESATEALDALRGVEPDVIITDISLPEMDGMELMREVSKEYKHMPVILFSGFVTKEICMDALATGTAGVLEKPFDHELLLSMVQVTSERYQAFKRMRKSIDMIYYQFSNVDQLLQDNGMTSQREALQQELKSLMEEKKSLIGGRARDDEAL